MKKNSKKNTNELTWVNDRFAIDGVNNYSDDVTFFNLHVKTALGDMTVYGCRVISGSKGDFISFPSRKGEDDKYYNYCFIKFSDDDTESIIDTVAGMI